MPIVIRRMITKGYANCSDGQIHFRQAGSVGKPVVCLFHQTASSGAMFEKVMGQLAGDFNCYAFDTPGFGGSYQPEEIPSIGFLADRLLEAVDDLGIQRFHACGHHTGGCIAMEMPAKAPEVVTSLAVIGPVLVNDEEKREYMKTFVQPFKIEASGEYLKTAWEYLTDDWRIRLRGTTQPREWWIT